MIGGMTLLAGAAEKFSGREVTKRVSNMTDCDTGTLATTRATKYDDNQGNSRRIEYRVSTNVPE